jgi:hypothetical protein
MKLEQSPNYTRPPFPTCVTSIWPLFPPHRQTTSFCNDVLISGIIFPVSGIISLIWICPIKGGIPKNASRETDDKPSGFRRTHAYPILGQSNVYIWHWCFLSGVYYPSNLVPQGKKGGAPSPQPHVIIIYHELLQLWAVPGQHLQGFYHFIVLVTKSWASDVQLSSENGIPIPWVQKQVSWLRWQ